VLGWFKNNKRGGRAVNLPLLVDQDAKSLCRGKLPAMTEYTTPTIEPPATLRNRRRRIGVSVFFGVVALAICGLWISSYQTNVVFQGEIPKRHAFSIQSRNGAVHIYLLHATVKWVLGTSRPGVVMVSQWKETGIFTFTNNSALTTVSIPHWFLLLASISTGAVAWYPIRTRFSLRTMLIATTLAAVVLGLFAWSVR
jgi:hypothetical protein